jgi:hypothetical protein
MAKEYSNFIKTTAKDYDMEPEEVERIFNDSLYEEFYQNLEQFIKERSNQ